MDETRRAGDCLLRGILDLNAGSSASIFGANFQCDGLNKFLMPFAPVLITTKENSLLEFWHE
jgi:hypothetical protein